MLGAYQDAQRKHQHYIDAWEEFGQKKVAVKVPNEEAMDAVAERVRASGIPYYVVVRDLHCVHRPTVVYGGCVAGGRWPHAGRPWVPHCVGHWAGSRVGLPRADWVSEAAVSIPSCLSFPYLATTGTTASARTQLSIDTAQGGWIRCLAPTLYGIGLIWTKQPLAGQCVFAIERLELRSTP